MVDRATASRVAITGNPLFINTPVRPYLALRTAPRLVERDGQVYSPDRLPESLFSCHAIGSGVKLVTTQALAHMPRPWFGLDFDKDGMLSVSDDAWLCQQAARIGIETWCDPTIRAGHIGSFEF